MNRNSVPKIHVRYKRYLKEQKDIWESFCLVDFYCDHIKSAIKQDSFPALPLQSIWNQSTKTLGKDDTFGALSSLKRKSNPRRCLLEAVLIFEDYITDLIEVVYSDYPQKLNSTSDDASNNSKLLKIILESDDKDEMVNKIIEEKIRSIFYGNPLDVFEKDKAKLELKNYFKDNHADELKKYRIIVATRNIIAHNNGHIDRKFIKETSSSATLGSKAQITKEFLKETTSILTLIATETTRLVIENLYKATPQGRLAITINTIRNLKAT